MSDATPHNDNGHADRISEPAVIVLESVAHTTPCAVRNSRESHKIRRAIADRLAASEFRGFRRRMAFLAQAFDLVPTRVFGTCPNCNLPFVARLDIDYSGLHSPDTVRLVYEVTIGSAVGL